MTEPTTIPGFRPYLGLHCETSVLGNLLQHGGLSLSEPMLFGLGEGLSYIVWNMKLMDIPFIGGRVKPDTLTENFCANLGLGLEVNETASTTKAWEAVISRIEAGDPVGLKLDSYHLDYFTNKIHFAGHYCTLYGFDGKYGFLADTVQQGPLQKALLSNIALARNEKGPMASKNRSFVIRVPGRVVELRDILPGALHRNAQAFLNPPIRNLAWKGIRKTADELKKWFRASQNPVKDFRLQALLMEKAGTGGSLFRNLYRDFLGETAEILPRKEIKTAFRIYRTVAEMWKAVSETFLESAETGSEMPLEKASCCSSKSRNRKSGRWKNSYLFKIRYR